VWILKMKILFDMKPKSSEQFSKSESISIFIHLLHTHTHPKPTIYYRLTDRLHIHGLYISYNFTFNMILYKNTRDFWSGRDMYYMRTLYIHFGRSRSRNQRHGTINLPLICARRRSTSSLLQDVFY